MKKKQKKKNPRIHLPTLTPVDDDEDDDNEPLGPILSPLIELINCD
jgi:hypothetical protein